MMHAVPTPGKITKAGQVTRFLQSMSGFREWFVIVGLFLAPNGDRIIINRTLVWSKLIVCIVLFCFFSSKRLLFLPAESCHTGRAFLSQTKQVCEYKK